MKDGILILNKPRDWTSHDCVAVCRRILGIKKIGHGGTLDPMAEGVLPIFIGKATRIMEYLDLDYKTYMCTAKLGVITDTQDIWGKTLEEHSTENVTGEDIANALGNFRGDIEQIPPKYSALKVNGKKLYEYAREGREVEIKPRKVHIKSLKIISIDMVNMDVSFEAVCSKGTYIRTICHDLGGILGCGGAMAALTRTASGIFTLDSAISPEDMKSMELCDIERLVMPVDRPLVHFGEIWINDDWAKYFGSGNSIRWQQVKVVGKPEPKAMMYRVYKSETYRKQKEFLGTGYYYEEQGGVVLKAHKIFAKKP